MPPATNPQITRKPRRDGWTPPRRQAFLDALAAGLDVGRACARAGLSRRSAYNLRAREAGFARAWGEARRAARAADERRFRALLAEHLPWTLSELSGECQLRAPEARSWTVSQVSGACQLRRAPGRRFGLTFA